MTDKKELSWFELMWKNSYIQLFLVAIAFLVILLVIKDEVYEPWMFYVGIAVPIGMMVMIAYKGFYQFWCDYKEGKSR